MDNNQKEAEVRKNLTVGSDSDESLLPDSERPAIMEQALVAELVEDHHAALYLFAYRLSGSRNDAEDLTQETYLIAQTRYDQLRKRECARSWLFSILRNLFLKQLRKQPKELTFLVEEHLAEEEVCATETDISPEILQAAIEELAEEFRTPLILYYFEEMSYKQIANFMDVPIGTIMSRLARAKSHLRTRLSPIHTHK